MVLGGAPESDPSVPQAVGVARVGLPAQELGLGSCWEAMTPA